jgi:hypothetical protein
MVFIEGSYPGLCQNSDSPAREIGPDRFKGWKAHHHITDPVRSPNKYPLDLAFVYRPPTRDSHHFP